jgi:hypothetical protein
LSLSAQTMATYWPVRGFNTLRNKNLNFSQFNIIFQNFSKNGNVKTYKGALLYESFHDQALWGVGQHPNTITHS